MGSYKMVLIALISSLTRYIENVYKSPPLAPIPIPTPLNRDSGCPKGDGRGSEYSAQGVHGSHFMRRSFRHSGTYYSYI